MWGIDNIVDAFQFSDRVYEVNLSTVADSQLEKVFAEMQQPFPEFTDLTLISNSERAPMIPDPFLGGFAAARLESSFESHSTSAE
jgi:hypothetical protein